MRTAQATDMVLYEVTSVVDDRGAPGGSLEPAVRLSVLSGFELRIDGKVVTVCRNSERLLAILAVRERPQLRATVAGTFWMDMPEPRAAANLRTVLWRTRRSLGDALRTDGNYIWLAPEVEIDLSLLVAQAKRLIGFGDELLECDTDAEALVGDLLPTWEEDWIMFERERLRQLRVHALEALCRRLSAAGRHGEAVDAGQAAVAAEPLRESAQRTLIGAHLAEGNHSEARRQYELYRELLWGDMGLEPSDVLRSMLSLRHP